MGGWDRASLSAVTLLNVHADDAQLCDREPNIRKRTWPHGSATTAGKLTGLSRSQRARRRRKQALCLFMYKTFLSVPPGLAPPAQIVHEGDTDQWDGEEDVEKIGVSCGGPQMAVAVAEEIWWSTEWSLEVAATMCSSEGSSLEIPRRRSCREHGVCKDSLSPSQRERGDATPLDPCKWHAQLTWLLKDAERAAARRKFHCYWLKLVRFDASVTVFMEVEKSTPTSVPKPTCDYCGCFLEQREIVWKGSVCLTHSSLVCIDCFDDPKVVSVRCIFGGPLPGTLVGYKTATLSTRTFHRIAQKVKAARPAVPLSAWIPKQSRQDVTEHPIALKVNDNVCDSTFRFRIKSRAAV